MIKALKKKGQMMTGAINTLLTLGIGVMVLAIALAFGQDITGDLSDDFVDTSIAACGTNATGGSGGTILYTGCGLEYNASVDGQTAMAEVTGKAPTVSKVGVAVVIIGLIVGGFGVYFSRR